MNNGQTLTVTGSPWVGAQPIVMSYQWSRNGTPVSTAANWTLNFAGADSTGDVLSVAVTGTNLFGSTTRSASITLVNTDTPPTYYEDPVYPLHLTGGGSSEPVVVDSITSIMGTPAPGYVVKWFRNGIEIAGQTGASLSPANFAAGNVITASVTATNYLGSLVMAVPNSITIIDDTPQPG